MVWLPTALWKSVADEEVAGEGSAESAGELDTVEERDFIATAASIGFRAPRQDPRTASGISNRVIPEWSLPPNPPCPEASSSCDSSDGTAGKESEEGVRSIRRKVNTSMQSVGET